MSRARFRRVRMFMSGTYRATRQENRRRGHEKGGFMRIRIAVGAMTVGIGLLWSQAPLWAHHAFAAEFDAKKPVKFLDATVTKVSLINPHSWIYVDVKHPDGKVEN